jgi:hypothetical protein
MEIRINIVGPLVLGGILTLAAQWCNCFLAQEMEITPETLLAGLHVLKGSVTSQASATAFLPKSRQESGDGWGHCRFRFTVGSVT